MSPHSSADTSKYRSLAVIRAEAAARQAQMNRDFDRQEFIGGIVMFLIAAGTVAAYYFGI